MFAAKMNTYNDNNFVKLHLIFQHNEGQQILDALGLRLVTQNSAQTRFDGLQLG